MTKRGFEVIFLWQPLDDFIIELGEFDGKSLVSVRRPALSLPEDKEEKKKFEETKTQFAPLPEVKQEHEATQRSIWGVLFASKSSPDYDTNVAQFNEAANCFEVIRLLAKFSERNLSFSKRSR